MISPANLLAYSYYVRISAVNTQEPLSGVTVVVNESGDEATVERVIDASRQLYAKKLEPEEQRPAESKQEDTPKVSKKPIKPKKKRASKKSDNELSAMKSVP